VEEASDPSVQHLILILFDMPVMSKKTIATKEITLCHPIVVSFENNLKCNYDLRDSPPTPQGEIAFKAV
jgi:hypothetical protein